VTPRVALWSAVAVCALLVLVPGIDLVISGWFYDAGRGFAWDGAPLAEAIHELVQILVRAAAVLLLLAALWTWLAERRWLGLDARRWTFLALALAIGLTLALRRGYYLPSRRQERQDLQESWRSWRLVDYAGAL